MKKIASQILFVIIGIAIGFWLIGQAVHVVRNKYHKQTDSKLLASTPSTPTEEPTYSDL